MDRIKVYIAIAVAIVVGYIIGQVTFEPQHIFVDASSPPIDTRKAMEDMRRAYLAHKDYANNPQMCNEFTGNATQHREWMDIYIDQITLIKWIEEVQ